MFLGSECGICTQSDLDNVADTPLFSSLRQVKTTIKNNIGCAVNVQRRLLYKIWVISCQFDRASGIFKMY
jgi:hypothetical protein